MSRASERQLMDQLTENIIALRKARSAEDGKAIAKAKTAIDIIITRRTAALKASVANDQS